MQQVLSASGSVSQSEERKTLARVRWAKCTRVSSSGSMSSEVETLCELHHVVDDFPQSSETVFIPAKKYIHLAFFNNCGFG